MRTLLTIAAAVALCACQGEPKGPAPDFGAGQAASASVAAQLACASGGFADLESCVDAPDQGVRRQAKTALMMEETYYRLCSEAYGAERCGAMLLSAFAVAKK